MSLLKVLCKHNIGDRKKCKETKKSILNKPSRKPWFLNNLNQEKYIKI